MIDMRLNLNDNIKAKLTEHGKDIYYHQYDRINKLLGREVCKPSYPKVDEDGYTTFQLWCFIELYGIYIGMTLPNVIEPLDIVFDAPTIEPERKKGEWIERNPQNSPDCRLIECSECGNAYIVGYDIDYDDWIDGRNFCMKCGADLRGGSNGKST